MMANQTLEKSLSALEKDLKASPDKITKRKELIQLLDKHQESLNDEQNKLLLSNIQLATEESGNGDFDLLKLYIKHLYRLRSMSVLADVAYTTHKAFPDKIYPLEWLCKVYLEYCTKALDFEEHPVMDEAAVFTEKLLKLNPKSNLGNMCLGAVHLFVENRVDQCINLLTPLLHKVGANPNFYAHFVLSIALSNQQQFVKAEKVIRKSLSLLSKVKELCVRERKKNELNEMLLKALYYQLNFNYNKDPLKRCIEQIGDYREDTNDLMMKAKVRLDIDTSEDVEVKLNEKTKSFLEVLKLQRKGDCKAALVLLKKTSNAETDFEELITMGELQLALVDSNAAMSSFLKAAKLNSTHYLPFAHLGIIYKNRKDWEKAKKCLLKSIELNGESTLAGCALSDLLKQQNEENELSRLLKSVLSDNPRCHWANLQLGLLYLDQNNPTKAITTIQIALRTSPTDVKTWEILAHAYRIRGSYTAALKAYHKILELSNDEQKKALTNLQIGLIYKDLGQLDEALIHLEDSSLSVISEQREFLKVLWLNGLAETLLLKLKDASRCSLEEKALDYGMRSVEKLSQSLLSDSNLAQTWSLLASTLTSLSTLNDGQLNRFRVPANLVLKRALQDTPESRAEELLLLACTCLKKAINIRPRSLGLWRDLGKNFHLVSTHKKNDGNDWLQKAMKALKNALSIENKCHLTWNYMGLVAMDLKKMAMAQHAFIKSIECEANVSAWTNLGVLYFTLGDQMLANAAFGKAQSLSPDSMRCWLGQAMLAELQHYDEEAMDLFRHANGLGNHPQASLGYAFWVCKTLKKLDDNEKVAVHSKYSLERMHGVTVALDALDRTHHFPESEDELCARNYRAFLLARREHFYMAAKQLRMGIDNFKKKGGCSNHNGEDGLNSRILSMQINLALLWTRSGDFEAPIKLLNDVSDQTKSPNCYSLLALALSHFKMGNFEQSYKCYESCLRLDEKHVSDILTAMACIAFKYQGSKAAKTLLFQGCQRQPVSVAGVFALAVLGYQEDSDELIGAAMQLLKQHKDNEKWRVHVAKLSAAVNSRGSVNKDQHVIGKSIIGKCIHLYPQDASLWLALEPFLKTSEALRMGIKALCLGKQSQTSSQSTIKLILRQRLQAAKSSEGSNYYTQALAAVHERPEDSLAWLWLALECRLSNQLKTASTLTSKASYINPEINKELVSLVLQVK